MKTKYTVNNIFVIENYNHAKTFASFFPGISGIWGKPLWLYYVNRGQAVSCFGIKDKDGAMLEFLPANKAYRNTPLQGFRTFLKIDGKFYEPFQPNLNSKNGQTLQIAAHSLKLSDQQPEFGIETEVLYHTLPNTTFPGLVRKLTVKNSSNKTKTIDWIDGLPMITPFGTNDFLLKNMSRIAEGLYSGVLFSPKSKTPIYKLAIQPHDKPQIIPIAEGHFYTGFFTQGKKTSIPQIIVDHQNIFDSTSSFLFPEKFINEKNFKIDFNLVSKNKTPSAMAHGKCVLKAGETFTYYSVVGHAQKTEDVDSYVAQIHKSGFLEKKYSENEKLIEDISATLLTRSSSQAFDNYCRQAYLDNIIRGGFPITLGKGKNAKQLYLYSRIHGDMEREYNNFVLLPENFSQGNGNYRDINQNRRNDVILNPKIKDANILTFINLIQTDGFNPLKVLGSQWKVNNKQPILKALKASNLDSVKAFLEKPFSLGSFFEFLRKNNIQITVPNEDFLDIVMNVSEKIDLADAGEGYWSDHWHYVLDLIENFLAIYPEQKKMLLLDEKKFTFFDNVHVVAPRSEKYVLSEGEPRQYHSVLVSQEKNELIKKRTEKPFVMRSKNGKGEIYQTTLISKLLCLISNKYASLDPDGIGIEMEADKPNWCDALNGLPGIFGSSTAESIELKRFIEFVKESLADSLEESILLPQEVFELFIELHEITRSHSKDSYKFWDLTHNAKENYRRLTKFGFSGKESSISAETVHEILGVFLKKVDSGIEKAWDSKTGVINTYFEYIPQKYSVVKENGKEKKNKYGETFIQIAQFKRKALPIFLEGPVHYLRTLNGSEKAAKLHQQMLKSELFDKKIKMMKLNSSLKEADVKIGRIKIFTPGWLENESVFMHMEYKYLLELLKNNLESEFFTLSKTALVPFMNPEVYGRSIFENSSFIVSSAHPESQIHGQGFVSRLTGTTTEFIAIWIELTSGSNPYALDKDGNLTLKFTPKLSAELFTKEAVENTPKNAFGFLFSGYTWINYLNPSRKNTFGKNKAVVKQYELIYSDKSKKYVEGEIIPAPYSQDVRDQKVKQINVLLG